MSDWKQLQNAHSLMRQAKVHEGIKQYQSLFVKDLPRYFYDRIWGISDDPATPSLNWACVYLGEYYMKAQLWQDWLYLFRFFQSSFDGLSNSCRSRLTSLEGWSRLKVGGVDLQEMASKQCYALEHWATTDFEISSHKMVLGVIYRLMGREDDSFQCMKEGIEKLSFEDEPFYMLRSLDYFGSTYDVFRRTDATYIAKADAIYKKIGELVTLLNGDAESERQYYTIGWHYMYAGPIEQALWYFRMGRQSMREHGIYYEEYLNLYGQACAHMYLEQYDAALNDISEALSFFWGNANNSVSISITGEQVSVLMTSICLYILAEIYRFQGKFDEALEKATLSLEWHGYFDNPTHKYNTLICFADIYRAQNKPELAQSYQLEADELFGG